MIAISDECNDERTKKPNTIIMLPAIIGFIEPNLDIKTLEVEPKIKSTNAISAIIPFVVKC